MGSGSTRLRETQSSLRACTLLCGKARAPKRRESRYPFVSANSSCRIAGSVRNGFTLLEVMIVLVIVGVLAAIALPSYSQHITRANRTQAKQFMQDIANRQEQYLLDQRSYTATIGSGGLGMTPPSETSGLYTFAAAAGGNDCLGGALPTPGYSITATAIGGQANDGALCLDSVNNRTPVAKWQN